MEGIEPPTDALQKHYSTTELHWHLTKYTTFTSLVGHLGVTIYNYRPQTKKRRDSI
jgi:hypothetical protein